MFKLPQEVKKDIEDYRKSLEQYLKAEISASRFKGIRVPWGIYSHRGGKVFMARIRIPAGEVTAQQLKALAQASRKFGDGMLHITTRQDIQIHNIKIEDTIKVIDFLKDYELSPRGGGGNTVRNIISCALAGICKDEVFDVRPYAIALSEYILRFDSSYTLPRKFKISFSGCARDCAGCMVNDVGLVAKLRDKERGFKVYTAGGMGANSMVGKVLEEFVTSSEIGYVVTAIKNVFFRRGERRDKHHNRLRFLVEDIGFDEFKRFYQEELNNLKESEHIALRNIELPYQEAENEEIVSPDSRGFEEFLKYNVFAQKQKGFYFVELRIPRGDISSQDLEAIADLSSHFSNIGFRTTQNQNLIITWLRGKEIKELFLRLKEILSDFLYPSTLLDVVACKGALTCNLGLCNSPGLAGAIETLITEKFLKSRIFSQLEIKINGCPNACGQHPIGILAFHGIVRRVEGKPVPFYKFLLAGRKGEGITQLAREVGIIPAKAVVSYLEEFLNYIEANWDGKTEIYDFIREQGYKMAEHLLEKYSYVPPYLEDKSFYIDWDRDEEFSLAGLGPGECGAGVLDMIEADLTDARVALEEAEAKDYDVELLRKALFLSARALLVVRGVDPQSPEIALREFEEKFIKAGISSEKYSGLDSFYEELGKEIEKDRRKDRYNFIKNFYAHVEWLYKNMDPSFNFPQAKECQTKPAEAKLLDLKGTPCPLNYVKAKLFLENLEKGVKVEILLDEGEPIQNVPKSLENDGHRILSLKKENGFYRLLLEKGGG